MHPKLDVSVTMYTHYHNCMQPLLSTLAINIVHLKKCVYCIMLLHETDNSHRFVHAVSVLLCSSLVTKACFFAYVCCSFLFVLWARFWFYY